VENECTSDTWTEDWYLLEKETEFKCGWGDIPENGREERKIIAIAAPLILFGTSSPITIPNDNCPAAAIPLHKFAPIKALMLGAVAPTIQPIVPRTWHPRTWKIYQLCY
jgi:hypothetical protein